MKSDNVRVSRAAKPICQRMAERSKVLNPEYNIFRDQPTPGASPLRINTLSSRVFAVEGDRRNLRFGISAPFAVFSGVASDLPATFFEDRDN